MALTPEGTPYVESSDLVANYPAASLSLANRVDLVGVLPFADSTARGTAIPSPTDGQYSYLQDTNVTEFWNGSAWTAAGGAPGLVHIATATLSAAASVTINTCFTATYANYVMYFSLTGSVDNNVLMQMRNAGSTITAANYSWFQVGFTNGNTSANAFSNGQTAWRIGQAASTIPAVGFVNFYEPLTSRAQMLNGGATGFDTTNASTQFTGFRYSTSQAFDSIVVSASTGNLSGTLRIYGLKNS